jgi:hypothetical protein
VGDMIRETAEQIAGRKLSAISDAAKALRLAGLNESTVERLLAESFPDYKGAFSLLSDGTKKQLEAAHQGLSKSNPDLTLATKSGRWEVLRKAANDHGAGATENDRVVDYLERHSDAHVWHNQGAEGEAVIDKAPVQKAVALRSVKERALAKLDGLARAAMAKDNVSYPIAYDAACMSAEGRELWELSADVYASDKTLTEFRKTLDREHQRFADGKHESYRQRMAKRLGAL